MAFTLPTGITHGSKSRISNPKLHPGFDEQYNNNNSRNCRRNNYNNLWVSIKQMDWGKYNPYISLFRRYSRLRFNIHLTHSWRSIRARIGNKSSKSGTISNRNRPRNRHYFYYGILISLLSIAPAKAETDNVANPVAAATGNVTNQAVQFQNNGAPSRQHYGPNISCNGATMTFSPFYMGNHTKPWDIDEDGMRPSSYTLAENWGGQINFMIPLDREGLNRCRSIAARQEEKMRLDYELVRVLKCAELQQKGFMLLPGSDIGHMCHDVIPIKTWEKAKAKVLKCKTPPRPWYKPWSKPEETCSMSSFTDKNKNGKPSLDGPNDLTPKVKTSFIIQQEAAEAAKKEKASESKK